MRDRVGDGAERDDRVAAEPFDASHDALDVRRPGDVGFDAFEDDEVVGAGVRTAGKTFAGHTISALPVEDLDRRAGPR